MANGEEWGRVSRFSDWFLNPITLHRNALALITLNMALVLLTLDVSKLRGWLKTNAYCRVEGRACDAGRGVRAGRQGSKGRGGGSGWRKRRARGRPTTVKDWGTGHMHGERTWNTLFMFVTLDVSKLTGWLNCLAFCRVEGRACDAGRGARGPESGGAIGRGAAAGASAAHTRRTLATVEDWGAGHMRRSAHKTSSLCPLLWTCRSSPAG